MLNARFACALVTPNSHPLTSLTALPRSCAAAAVDLSRTWWSRGAVKADSAEEELLLVANINGMYSDDAGGGRMRPQL